MVCASVNSKVLQSIEIVNFKVSVLVGLYVNLVFIYNNCLSTIKRSEDSRLLYLVIEKAPTCIWQVGNTVTGINMVCTQFGGCYGCYGALVHVQLGRGFAC